MNRADLERAVIEAARIMSDEGVCDHWTACAVVVAVEELRKFEREQAGRTLEDLENEISKRSVRAHHVFVRMRQRAERSAGWPRHYWDWPPLATVQTFADLDEDAILGVRNAGPKTWAAWRDALRAFGFESAWSKVVGDE